MKLIVFSRIGIIAFFFFILIFFSTIISFISDWFWFSDLGFLTRFTTSLKLLALIGIISGFASAIFIYFNFIAAITSKIAWIGTIPESLLGHKMSLSDSYVKKLAIIISLVSGIFIGFICASYWLEFMMALQSTSFNHKDMIFGNDISFYVFILPALTFILKLTKYILLITFIGVLLISFLKRSFSILEFLAKFSFLTKQKISSNEKTAYSTRLHIGILLSLFLLVSGGELYISMYDTLFNLRPSVEGVSFTDASIIIPFIQITVVVYVLAAVFAFIYGIFGKVMPLLACLAFVGVLQVTSALISPLVQRFIVAPNELEKETPFIKNHIKATQEAYNLTTIDKKTISIEKPLTSEIINENMTTIKNVRLWDRDPLLSTFSQIQEIRTYYEFASVDNDRYEINGELRQVMLSPRELQPESLPNRNWINEHLTFTHGYGIAAGPVNLVTPEGLPKLFVKNLPPVSEVPELSLQRPEIYFGEINNDYVIVNTKSKEFDYPKGEENVFSSYNSDKGIVLDTFFKKVLYAIKMGELKLLLSSDITNSSKILYHRNIKERVNKIVPFIEFDNDPYLVISQGKMYWILDGYTKTNKYPYAKTLTTKFGNLNYIRNSIKVVIDAYSGNVTLYISDNTDPIIRTYAKIFPSLFTPISQLPKDLAKHLRYPEDIFSIQTSIYTTYHMEDPQQFYNKEDQWEIPKDAQLNTTSQDIIPSMQPRHLIMRLPFEDNAEFIMMLPFTPRSKDNLSAWMAVRNDSSNYGKLLVYRFPKDKLVFGPKQIMGRINQDAEISRQISLWDQRGSQVIQGSMLIIPLNESLLYVRPLYLKADTGKIPELKRVIVAYENKIAMEETLEAALVKMFGDNQQTLTNQNNSVKQTPVASNGTTDLLNQANDAYDKAQQHLRNGDLTRYGEEIQRLGDILKSVKKE